MRRRAWLAAIGLVAVVSSWTYFFPPAPHLAPLARFDIPPAPMLVFAPHSDDEVMAAGGLLQDAQAKGADPYVVLVTAGDGFRLGAEAHFYRGRVRPADMQAYGKHRVSESRTALAKLGLPADHFIFLGFPDQYLHRLWMDCWQVSTPCTSVNTQASAVPYPDARKVGAPYAGRELLGQIEDVLRERRPKVVVYPHPNEAHVDHWGLSNFVSAALEELRRTEPDWQPPQEWFYLVHRGDWPAPKGYRPNEPLLPPPALSGGMTLWHARALSPDQVQRKGDALTAYRSQTMLMRRYLQSFVRSNELFGTIERVSLAPPGVRNLFAGPAPGRPPWADKDWALLLTDPRGDTLAREVERGADAMGAWVARDANSFYVAAPMAARPKRPVEIRVYARGFHPGQGWGDVVGVVVTPDGAHTFEKWPASAGRNGVTSDVQGTWARVGIPLDALGAPDSVMLNVETRVDGVLVDRTAWRPVALDGR